MKKDLWDLSERAEALVRKINFQGMTQDEIIGLFYQEFCEPTEVEKQYEIKYKWMLEHGFNQEKCNGQEFLVYNGDFYWCKEDVMYHTLSEIKKYFDLYKKDCENK